MDDLSDVDTTELLAELDRRFEDWIFLGKLLHDAPDGRAIYRRRWHGNDYVLIGLVTRARRDLLRDCDEEEPYDGE